MNCWYGFFWFELFFFFELKKPAGSSNQIDNDDSPYSPRVQVCCSLFFCALQQSLDTGYCRYYYSTKGTKILAVSETG